jgi:asparagine synthase (glutamine-hydrolysing)
MGQLLLVQGRDAEAAGRALRRLLDARARLATAAAAAATVATVASGATGPSAVTGPSRPGGAAGTPGEPGPHGTLETLGVGGTVLAHVPRRRGGGPPPQRLADGGATAGCGAWIAGGRHAPDALASLGSALRAGGEAWARAAATLEGAFVLAAADAGGRELVLATDRVGTQHAYHATLDGCLVVAGSALVLALATGAGLDGVAARELLGAGSVFEDRSLYAGVRKLPPGARLVVRDGRLAEERRWWEPAPRYHGTAAPLAAPGDVPALADGLVAAVGAALSCWPDAVLDLTGGFDSRAVLAAALVAGHRPRTVVVGADGDPDVVSAAGIARALDLPHVQLRPGVDHGPRALADLADALALTDGEADVVEYAGIAGIQTRMARSAGARGATVNGTAGELCRGYWWDLLPSTGRPGTAFDAPRAAAGRFATDGWADAMTAGRHADPLLAHFTGVVERAVGPLRALPAVALADHVYLDLRMQRWAGRLASATGCLWPCVSPFLFDAPMAAALSAPPALRQRDRMTRALIEHLHPALAALPMAGGYPALPVRASTLHRFGPLAAELGGKVRRRLFGAPAASPGPPGSHATLPALLRDPDVAACLVPDAMASAALYDAGALRAFLSAPDTRGAVACRRLARVLTIELAARALAGRAPAGG